MNSIWIILAGVLATVITRLAVLWLPKKAKESKFLFTLSKYLPVASFGLLIVYSIKNTDISSPPYGFPELIGLIVVIGFQLWKDNILLSIASGSVIYLLLVNVILL